MKLLRIGVIAGAHLFVIGIAYLMSGLGNSGPGIGEMATAGANGIVNWSNQDANAQATTVSTSGFDSRANDLTGFNAGDPSIENQGIVPEISSKQRFEPRRPGGSRPPTERPASTLQQPSQDNGILAPLGNRGLGSPTQPSSIIAPSAPSEIIRYTVRSGDSLWGISNRFGVTRDDLQSVNPGLTVNIQPGQVLNVPREGSVGSPPTGAQPTPVVVDGSTYTVKSGDALSIIAANQGVTVNDIRAANNLSGDLIRVGQKLVIPNSSSGRSNQPSRTAQGLQVVVAPGDSVFSIAERYGVTARDLILKNNIQNPARITPGQTLFIPSSSDAASPRTNPTTATPPPREDPTPVSLPTLIPEDPPVQLLDEDEFLEDEDLIDQPVIPIEN